MARPGRAALKEQRYDRQLRFVQLRSIESWAPQYWRGSYGGHREDLGSGAFLVRRDRELDLNRAQSAMELLQELNSDVSGNFVEESPEKLLDNDPSFFNRFNLVVATQLPESTLLRLAEVLWNSNIPLLVCRTYGLVGYMRVVIKEHTVVESHPDNMLEDLRLDKPFPELTEHVQDYDLEHMDKKDHSHTPWIVIVAKYLIKWFNEKSEQLPKSYKEKEAFKELIRQGILKNENGTPEDEENFEEEAIKNVNTALNHTEVPRGIEELFNDDCCPKTHGAVIHFIITRYREKAKKDIAAVGNHAAKLLQSLGKDNPDSEIVLYLMLRAVDRFYKQHGRYQVKLINKGLLDAPFTYIPSTTHVGSCFKFAPEEGIIAPGEIQTIQISFNATVVGYFDEQFQFSVAGSPTPVILTIKGCVHRPTLHFDVDELDFGDISFGFPFTKTCRLTNTSLVPVTFKLRVSDDGTQPAVSSFDQIRSDSDPSWRKGIHFSVKPREFTMNPSQGTILPQGHQDIEVTLCPNTVTEFCRKLLVDLEEIGEGVASLVLQARCFVPKLQVYPPILCIDDCCLKVPFERRFFIRNNTHLPGCYGLIPQERKEDSPVFYSSPKPCGIVQPQSTAEIPVVVEVQTLGRHRTRVPIGVFGDERNPLGIELQSYGKLSEIYPSPRLIEFGMIPVLQPNSQNFILFNEGLVPKYFRMKIVCKPHCYVIEPREGVIPADGAVPVTITATLDDTGVFDDVIQLFIGNSLWSILLLQALGVGSTIVIDKPFTPELNLGYQFR
ncbi:hypothetical protein DUI87_13974 [Hirundo rustica rustica]|uniref:HYDIN/VesB/CFA65-like Ig-like domain-containing protein n=1 Tax=Hirundo rustica rustica TaxID=333673 RepID=A0A3M0KP81_HIRRU|nr:hypothetical protein DUI87_13974 [Hirundo rustica rustica]